eukprot:c25049_g1_i2 orf=54-2567(-)
MADLSFQAVMEQCFTYSRLGASAQSFAFKCRQCTDIADFFAETGPKFRFSVWESYLRDQAKGGAAAATWRHCDKAVKNFCCAVKEAEVFLQHHCCTSAGKNDWKVCANGLTKLDTAEAYEVHLENLIWAKAGLELAISMYVDNGSPSAPHRNMIHMSDDVQKVVAKCRRVLCRYAYSYKEHRILMDRLDFNESIKSLIDGRTNAVDRFLAFLLGKSQAAACLPDRRSTASAAEHPDQLINAFEVSDHEFAGSDQELLGQGAYGKVYSTLWLGQIRVAVKVIPIYYGPDSKIDEADHDDTAAPDKMFKEEVSLLARLQSPYIVQLMGWAIDRSKGEGKLVTELMATDLGKVLRATESKNGLPLHVAVDMMLQVSKAIEYLRKKNIIHRDIKPSNILLEPSPIKEYWRVKVCDFGIAKMKPHQDDLFSTFKLGTEWYRSPEVLSEQVKYSNKADVYSFAITSSEMLGGYSATLRLSQGEGSLLSRILSDQRPSLPADCPAYLSDLIRKCWDNEPKKRPRFCDITSMLSYIKFILMRGVPAGVNFPLLTPFDEYELTACISRAAEMEAVQGDLANWDFDAASEDLRNPRSLLQHRRTRRWLQSKETLSPMESLTCGRYRLTMQKDGNLVLLDCDDMTYLWASGRTASKSIRGLPFICTLKSNGNLVVHSGKQEIWSSGSAGYQASYKLVIDFDGRAIIRSPNDSIIWANERTALNCGDMLFVNSSLRNNVYEFFMQADGNLVLYDEKHRPMWASGTCNRFKVKKCRCTLQDDGLLVILNENEQVWSSGSAGSILPSGNQPSYTLELQSDGNVVVRHPSGQCIWETRTGRDIESDESDESD